MVKDIRVFISNATWTTGLASSTSGRRCFIPTSRIVAALDGDYVCTGITGKGNPQRRARARFKALLVQSGLAGREGGVVYLATPYCGTCTLSHMLNLVEFKDWPDAAGMLHLARGQLNNAYRQQGLLSPNPLQTAVWLGIDPVEIDAPAAMGLTQARAMYSDTFEKWETVMPVILVQPVLSILLNALEILVREQNRGPAPTALWQAYTMLRQLALQSECLIVERMTIFH